jgi:ABC-type glutathione transport system ATPase component
VQNISFDLKVGEILCIVGESGSGKSVTTSAVLGLLSPAMKVTEGSVLFKGMDLVRADGAKLQALRGRSRCPARLPARAHLPGTAGPPFSMLLQLGSGGWIP